MLTRNLSGQRVPFTDVTISVFRVWCFSAAFGVLKVLRDFCAFKAVHKLPVRSVEITVWMDCCG